MINIPTKTLAQAGFTVGEELAHGNQGVIKFASDAAGVLRCLNVLSKANMNSQRLEQLKEEYDIMHQLNNEHIARTFDIFQDSSFYYLVNEPYLGTDFTRISLKARENSVNMTEAWWRNLFRQCFKGLQYLHRHALMHCDIKEGNIMTKTMDLFNPKIVIIDLGLAQQCVFEATHIVGTPGYMPPETWRTHKWFPKGDCFCMGVTMVQIFIDWIPTTPSMADSGKPRFGIYTAGVHSEAGVLEATATRPLPKHFLPQIPSLLELLSVLTEKCLERRLTSSQALDHAWFNATSEGGPTYDPIQMREMRERKSFHRSNMVQDIGWAPVQLGRFLRHSCA